MRRRKWILWLLALCVATVTTLLYVNSKPRQPLQGGPAYMAAALKFPVVRGDLSTSIEVKGRSSYVKESWVYAPFSGEIKEWRVRDGASVAAGEVLFVMDGAPLASSISSQEVQLQQHRLKVQQDQLAYDQYRPAGRPETDEEAQNAYQQKEQRRVTLEQSKLAVAQLEADLADNRSKLNQAQYRAAEDGIFLFQDAVEPQRAGSDPIGRIVDTTALELVTYVSEYEVFRLMEGLPVQVRVDALRQIRMEGAVESISKFARISGGNAQFEVRISLEPHEQLIAGLSLTATIVTNTREQVVVVPTIAVQLEGDRHFVYVEGGEGIERRYVTIGLETPDQTEIIEGLAEGETVVLQ